MVDGRAAAGDTRPASGAGTGPDGAAIPLIVLPGIGDSGPDHWQSLWQAGDPTIRRFAPRSFDRPVLADWIGALERALADAPAPAVVVAHSLSCLLVAHWAAIRPLGLARLRGAVLVAVPDPDGPVFPAEAAAFRPVPDAPLPCPALVIASTDDPYCALERARERAAAWGAGFVVAGACGHINASSGVGAWPAGRALVAAFAAGLGERGAADPHRSPGTGT